MRKLQAIWMIVRARRWVVVASDDKQDNHCWFHDGLTVHIANVIIHNLREKIDITVTDPAIKEVNKIINP